MSETSALDERILVLAPFGRDAQMAVDVLERANLAAEICCDITDLCAEFRNGAGALLIAHEVLSESAIAQLAAALDEQQAWSDIPIVVFIPAAAALMARYTSSSLDALRNVTLIERPVRIGALVSTLKSALRARQRQYLVRTLMEELRRSNQAKDAFVAAVSHELRTPLTAILGWAGRLRRTTDAGRVSAAVDVIERNARVLSQLVEDLLDLARVAHGQFRIETAPVAMPTVVRAAVDAVRPLADAKQIELVLDSGPSTLPLIVGDGVRLQQVAWNLLWNAVKFTPSGGRIQIELREETVQGLTNDRLPSPAGVELIVSDTGEGIAPDLLPHVFDAFRQGERSSGAASGLGLGLAIVRHLVELHGGSVTAHSQGKGAGATFRVRLPGLAVGREEGCPSLITESHREADLNL